MPKGPKHPPATVPKLWPGETFVLLASGPSQTSSDVDYCRGKARVIAVNNTYQLAPWADVLYACDAKWWLWHPDARSFGGLKYTLAQLPGLQRLENTGRNGLELKPNGLRTGSNSGYQAINLAVHLGAKRILLLGYDMQKHDGKWHYHGDHPQKSTLDFPRWILNFNGLAPQLKKHGVEVVNCSRRTALKCFPMMPITQALPESMAVAS